MAQSEKKKKTTEKKQRETAIPNINSIENAFANSYQRRLKMCYRSRLRCFGNYKQVPALHLSGNWLQKAGFETGNYTTLLVGEGVIVIRKEEDPEG